ncbi:amino acid deaminase/aldolase [Isoalcanivorax beigongshangi]|uniref:Amino acid deaminase/aldolase n=1 Tax=Isoalcanivorax beigongshangi TaxID=3238810 RepID=A0ABV4AHI7_9GAMM
MSAALLSALQHALINQPLPAAVLDLDAFDANLTALLTRAGRHPLRIASKSLRVPALIQRVLAADPRCQGVLCFHGREACALAEQGITDLLVAYPTVQPDTLRAVAEQLRQGRLITLMVDDAEQVKRIAEIGEQEHVVFPLCLDVDLSLPLPGLHFGVQRSPIRSASAAVACFDVIRALPSVRLEGVMGYEAQVAGVGDQVPGAALKNRLIRRLKQLSLPRLAARRQAVVNALEQAGAKLRFVNGGGTGSLETTCSDPSVTEVSAGSGLFAPVLFDHYQDFQHSPSLFFALEVVRQPQADVVTCAGGGYIASGAAGSDRLPTPVWPPGLSLLPLEGAGEVQTPLRGSRLPAIGDAVLFRHAKAGELCERFNQVLVVQGGTVTGGLPTYRGLGWQFM